MNVQEMLESVGFDDIWVYVMAEYCRRLTPDESARTYVSLKRMYGDLLSRTPEDNSDGMVLTVKRLSNGGEPFWDTAAFCGRDGQTYSISFVDWDKVLGYEMLRLSVDEYGVSRTAAHFLWELSKDGFSEEEMRRHRCELENAVNSELSEALSLDDLCAELGFSLFSEDDDAVSRSSEDEENENISRKFENAAAEQIKNRF